MDGIYRRQRFIYDATRRYYLLGRDRLIADLRVPGEAHACWRSAAARRAISSSRAALSGGAPLRHRHFRGDAADGARLGRARRPCGARSRSRPAMRRLSTPGALFGVDSFDRVFISYALSMIPAWTDVVKSAAACVAPGGSAADRRFRRFRPISGADAAGSARLAAAASR